MAKKTNQESAPDFIDYEGQDAPSESTAGRNAFANCKGYWKRTLYRVHRAGGILWGIKEQSLLSRLLKEFSEDDIRDMMTVWISSNQLEKAIKFNFFYTRRYELYDLIKPKDYDW